MYISTLKGIRPAAARARVQEMLHLTGMTQFKNKKMKSLSGGMKRRAGIAQAVLNDPIILILDEPTAGLDPGEQIRFRNLISELAADRIVLLSTHIVSDVESVAGQIILMKDGKFLVTGTSEEIIGSCPNRSWICNIPKDQVLACHQKYQVVNVKTVADHTQLRILSPNEPMPGAVPEDTSLEDVFLSYFGEKSGGEDGNGMVWYEIKKILLRPSCQIALLLLLLLSGRFCIQVMWGPESAYWINEDGQMETGYNAMQKLRVAQAEWSGELNQELLEKALAELKQAESEGESHPEDYAYKRCQGLQNIRALMNNAFKSNYVWKYEDWYLAETLEPELDFYENRTRQLKDWLYDENSSGYQAFSEQEKQYLIRCYESLDTPFEVGYTAGWDMAYRISYYIILYGSILMAFLTAGIIANESRWKTNTLYFCTVLGQYLQ